MFSWWRESKLSSFKDLELSPLILKGVYAAGFEQPFPIQEKAIKPLLDGSDVIGQARTGSGKTAAYGLPLLNNINTDNYSVQGLILAPTRELAIQITRDIKKLGKFISVKTLTIYGGQSINLQFEALRRGPHIIVGTPGRVIDHLKRGTLDLKSTKFVVLDEADTMLEMGFIEDVEYIMDSISGRKQLSLFSATMPSRIIKLSSKYMHNPERILIDSDEPSVDTLDQYYTVVERDDKLPTLLNIMTEEKPSSTIIFCRTRHRTRQLARGLRHMNAVPLHGDLSQNQRDYSMSCFRSGRADVLVATDVASRGIDIRQVDCVINYEVPDNPLLYFHRVGRTARAGDSGKSFTLVSPDEFPDFNHILELTKAPIKPLRPEDEGRNFRNTHSKSNRPFKHKKFRRKDKLSESRYKWWRFDS